MFCVDLRKKTAIIFLYNINWLVFITETECVYCAIRTGYLNNNSRSFPSSNGLTRLPTAQAKFMLRDFDLASVFISILDDTAQSIPQLKIQIFWNIKTCRLVNSYRGFVPPSSGSGCTLFFENSNNLTVRTATSLETSVTLPFDTV